jgi:hypothetical protein
MKVPDGWIVEVKRGPAPWNTRWEYRFWKDGTELPIWYSGRFHDSRDRAIEVAIQGIEYEMKPKPPEEEWERA